MFLPPFRTGSSTSPRRCPAPLQKHAGSRSQQQCSSLTWHLPRVCASPGKGQRDPCGVPAPGGTGASGSTLRGTWGCPHPLKLHAGGVGWRRRSTGRLLPAVPSGKLLVKGGLWGSGCKPDWCGTVQPRPTRAGSYVSQMLASHGDHYFCLSTKSWQ